MRVEPVSIQWHSGLPIHASEAYLRVSGNPYGWIGGFDASGRQCCAVAYSVLNKVFIRMVRFRSVVMPLVEDFSVAEEKDFLNGIVKHFRATAGDMIIPAANNVLFRTYPDGAQAVPYGSYVIDLTQPEETLWRNLHSKHRNVVRNASKKGVEIRSGPEYVDQVYEMVRETLARSGMDFMSAEEFKQLVESLGDNVKLFVAKHQGVLQGAAMIPFSEYGAYYVYGGSTAEPLTGAMNLLHWEAIRHFQQVCVKRYDFVGVRINPEKGSKQERLKMFKERFGGDLVRGHMWKYPLHRLKYVVYHLAVRLFRGGDVVDQERRGPSDNVALSEFNKSAE